MNLRVGGWRGLGLRGEFEVALRGGTCDEDGKVIREVG